LMRPSPPDEPLGSVIGSAEIVRRTRHGISSDICLWHLSRWTHQGRTP
jgi:hypothetical protein